jgi:hypothetical protein
MVMEPAYKVAQRSRVSCPHCGKELAVKTLSSSHDCVSKRPRRPRKPNTPTSPEALQERLQRAQARHWAKFEKRMAAGLPPPEVVGYEVGSSDNP